MIPDTIRSRQQLKVDEQLPGIVHRCRCGGAYVWGRTVSKGRGRGGRAIPLEVMPDEAGSYAVEMTMSGRLLARPLKKGETAERGISVPAMPHAAVCPLTKVARR